MEKAFNYLTCLSVALIFIQLIHSFLYNKNGLLISFIKTEESFNQSKVSIYCGILLVIFLIGLFLYFKSNLDKINSNLFNTNEYISNIEENILEERNENIDISIVERLI